MFSIFGAVVGWSIYRFPGAIAGYFLGSFIDQYNGKRKNSGGQRDVFRDLFDQQRGKTVNPADFEINLLSLASFVIKADGTVSQSELDFVRRYFVQAYGKDRANATFKVFNDVIKKSDISAKGIASDIRSKTRYESRLQILHFLFSIANADGTVTYEGFGVGAVFMQSGLGYYVNPPPGSSVAIPVYSQLIFTFQLFETEIGDQDFDGVPSVLEDVNGNGLEEDDDTDSDNRSNYLDPDDDGDGRPTEDEIEINEDGTITFPDTDGDGVVDYLDSDS